MTFLPVPPTGIATLRTRDKPAARGTGYGVDRCAWLVEASPVRRALLLIGLFVASIVGLVACRATPPVEMVDVTPVWPLLSLPDLDAAGYIHATSQGAHGVVFPRRVFDSVPALTRVDEPDAIYQNLVVVGARIDPCFQEGDPAPCEASVRLVLQPLLPEAANSDVLEARDASIHAFYVVSDVKEILTAIAALASARADAALDGTGPLRVNPLLEDDAGRIAARDAILKVIGEDRLVRVTSMGVHGDNTAWSFSGFSVADIGKFTNPEQVFEQHVLSVGGRGAIEARVEPPLPGPESYSLLLEDTAARAATLAERQAAFDSAARIENPALYNSGTLDCVSCHLTAVARAAAIHREFLAPSPDAFTSEHRDLSVSDAFRDTEVVHNLAYRLNVLALSPRLIHESAVAADRADAALHP